MLQNAGPLGGPGMPEWGMLPLPNKLVKRGVRDMVRISDARMSGTATARACCTSRRKAMWAARWPWCKPATDRARCRARRIHLHVSDEELARRRTAWTPPPPRYARGYGAMYSQHIGQADEGCDFDFLQGTAPVAEPEIY